MQRNKYNNYSLDKCLSAGCELSGCEYESCFSYLSNNEIFKPS